MKKKLPFDIVSHERRQARITMNLPIYGPAFSLSAAATAADVAAHAKNLGDPAKPNTGQASQAPPAEPRFETFEDLKPKDSDYIFPLFRALSASIVEGYWLDYSTPGVLEAAVPMLQNQTVYADHVYWRVTEWVGVVQESAWDAKGAQSGGVAGINTKLKIDWKKNPWIARGLMMTPPAIHSVSVTVLFQYDFSHEELAEQDRFWDLLGEEVDGEIVRLIVTKILGFWELSLVFQGADTQAKQLDEGEEQPTEMAAARRGPITKKETGTVKLTAEQKKRLGLSEHTADDVPEATVLQSLDRLAARAEAGDRFVKSQRTECLRVATLAVVGAEDGKLPDALSKVISQAGGEELEGLITMYREQAEKRFPLTCQHCGSKEIKGRSSVEERADVEKAAQTKSSRKPVSASSIF